jgi:hypothetical protein
MLNQEFYLFYVIIFFEQLNKTLNKIKYQTN